MTNKIILALEAEQMTKEIPTFAPGDTIVVQVKVKEGDRARLQAFEGVVIAKRNRGVNSAFTVRKISNGVGVERTFQTYSPQIDSMAVKRRGDVRKAKLYYLRDLSGKAALLFCILTHRFHKTTNLQLLVFVLFSVYQFRFSKYQKQCGETYLIMQRRRTRWALRFFWNFPKP